MPSPQVQAGTNGIGSTRSVTTGSQLNDQHFEAYDQNFAEAWNIVEAMMNQIANLDDVPRANNDDHDNSDNLSCLLFPLIALRHTLGKVRHVLHALARYPLPRVHPGSAPRVPLAR